MNIPPLLLRCSSGRADLPGRLPAGMGVTLDMKMARLANQPSYAFPWHGDRVPVR